jgi:nucleotide-binding universal stress UspA family protein
MGKVLMAVDETAGSESVLSVFKAMVREPESVVLVHVQRLEGAPRKAGMPGETELKGLKEPTEGTEYKTALHRTSEKIVSFYTRELEAGGSVKVKALIREGIPAEEILKAAREEKVDLIVMGGDGKTGLRRLVSGCAAREVERAATVPVLVAQTAGRKKSIQSNFRGREEYAA